jgi:hypothetical protein
MRAGWWIGWLAAALRDGRGSGLLIGVGQPLGSPEDYGLIILKFFSNNPVKILISCNNL